MATSTRWHKAMVVAAATAAVLSSCAGPGAFAQAPAVTVDGAAAAAAAAAPPVIPGDPAALSAMLRSSESPEVRESAAAKLVALRTAEARDALVDALRSGDANAQLAAARALADQAWPDPAFIEPLFTLLDSRQTTRTTAAGGALAQYKGDDNVLRRLATIATRKGDDLTRVPVIRAIGTFDRKLSAATLTSLLQSLDEAREIYVAAGNALIDMTGHSEFGHDVQQWANWWGANQNKSDAQFTADLLNYRAQVFEREVARRRLLEDRVAKLLDDLYTQAAPADQPDILLRYLKSQAPEIRALGTGIVYEALRSPNPPPPAAMAQVRSMVADPSPDVRAAVAAALFNDAAAAPALLAQLGVETDENARIAQIRSLTPLHSADVVQALLALLQTDASERVRRAAAEGIADAGEKSPLFDTDANLRNQAAQVTQAVLRSTDNNPAAQQLRESVVRAMASLHDPDLMNALSDLVAPRESVPTRMFAIEGLGALKRPRQLGEMLKGFFYDPSPSIRLAAVQALGATPAPEYAQDLLNRMQNDPDPSVRDATWGVFQSWLPQLDDGALANLAGGLKGNPDKQLTVVRALIDHLTAEASDAKLAPAQRQAAADALPTQQQNAGDLLMTLDRPADAAEQFAAALDYWKRRPDAPPSVLDRLSQSLAEALLKSNQFDKAAGLASATVKDYDQAADPELRRIVATVATEFRVRANDLDKADDFEHADQLSKAVGVMSPPLPGNLLQGITNILDGIRRRKPAGA